MVIIPKQNAVKHCLVVISVLQLLLCSQRGQKWHGRLSTIHLLPINPIQVKGFTSELNEFWIAATVSVACLAPFDPLNAQFLRLASILIAQRIKDGHHHTFMSRCNTVVFVDATAMINILFP